MIPISPELILDAYACGIFPMAETRSDEEVFWVDPEIRGVLELDHFHISRSLHRTIRSNRFTISVNREFRNVINSCSEFSPKRKDTWINSQILNVFCQLHELGYAHSIECWNNKKLVGGLYGLSLGAAFFGESMFSKESNTSKIAFVHLVDRLKQGNFTLLDTQFVTPHLKSLGVKEMPRGLYLDKLRDAIQREANFCSPNYPPVCGALPESINFSSVLMQRNTQTS